MNWWMEKRCYVFWSILYICLCVSCVVYKGRYGEKMCKRRGVPIVRYSGEKGSFQEFMECIFVRILKNVQGASIYLLNICSQVIENVIWHVLDVIRMGSVNFKHI